MGFFQGLVNTDAEIERTRAAKADADWAAYLRSRQQSQDAMFDQGKQEAIDYASKDPGQFDAGKVLGLRTPAQTLGPTGLDSASMGSDAGIYRRAGVDQSALPQPTQVPSAPISMPLDRGEMFNSQRQMGLSALKMATRPDQILEIQKALQQQKLMAEDTAIQNHIYQLPENEIAKLAGTVSADKRNTFNVVPDPANKGLFIVKEGDTSIPMNREQLARWFGASHRMNAGDSSAVAEIAKISPELAARQKEMFEQATKMASESKDNFVATSGRITADATAGLNAAHARYFNSMVGKIAEETKDRAAAIKAITPYIEEFKKLDPKDQMGEKGKSILFNAQFASAQASRDVGGIMNTAVAMTKAEKNKTEILKNPEGGGIAVSTDPSGNQKITSAFDENGAMRPPGWSKKQFSEYMDQAHQLGVPAVDVIDSSGRPTIAFEGKDGKRYPDPHSAAKAKAPKQTAIADTRTTTPAADTPRESALDPSAVSRRLKMVTEMNVDPTTLGIRITPPMRGSKSRVIYGGKEYPSVEAAKVAWANGGGEPPIVNNTNIHWANGAD